MFPIAIPLRATVLELRAIVRNLQGSYLGNPTVVDENINIMKTTFDLNFDFYQAFKQHGYI